MTEAQQMYGDALYSLAAEEHCEDEVLAGVQLVQQLLAENPDYLRLVQNPAVEKEQRLHFLDEALRGNVHLYVLNFVKILCGKSALDLLDGCAQAYVQRLHQARGILCAQAVSAVALTAEQKDALTQKLQAATGKTILLETKVDPALMGGVVVRYEGKELDGSVTGRLAAVRQMLLTEC